MIIIRVEVQAANLKGVMSSVYIYLFSLLFL